MGTSWEHPRLVQGISRVGGLESNQIGFMQKKIPTSESAGIPLFLSICLLVELFFACAKSVLVCAFADDTTGHNHIVSHIFVLIVS